MKAFPFIIESEKVAEPGMDLRDYFAAKAMQARIPSGVKNSLDAEWVAIHSYIIADFMMKAREE